MTKVSNIFEDDFEDDSDINCDHLILMEMIGISTSPLIMAILIWMGTIHTVKKRECCVKEQDGKCHSRYTPPTSLIQLYQAAKWCWVSSIKWEAEEVMSVE